MLDPVKLELQGHPMWVLRTGFLHEKKQLLLTTEQSLQSPTLWYLCFLVYICMLIFTEVELEAYRACMSKLFLDNVKVSFSISVMSISVSIYLITNEIQHILSAYWC